MEASFWWDQLAGRVRSRRWLIAVDHLAGATGTVAHLQALGATEIAAIAGSRGTGALPDLPAERLRSLDLVGPDMMAVIRASEAAMDALDDDSRAWVDAFDPDRSARVIRPMFSTGGPVAGRRTWGARPLAWQRLEDKTVVDRLWAALGIPTAPHRVVPAERGALDRAARALDQGAGTVQVGDNREGFHGGASYLRWVTDERSAAGAARFFAEHCDRVRVMPFLEGIPCSVHGIVLPGPGDTSATIAVRPMEMLVLRRPGDARLQYAGAGSYWDPPAADRDAMRALAVRVGDHLGATVGYRGVFTLDGILTEHGFRPTEINPRFGVALRPAGGADLPLYLLHCAAVEGEPIDWRPAELEALLIRRADGRRASRVGIMVSTPVAEARDLAVVAGEGEWREAAEGETPDARLALGPGPMGGYLWVALDPDRTPVGPSVAPRVQRACALADRVWGTGIGPLEPARDVRS